MLEVVLYVLEMLDGVHCVRYVLLCMLAATVEGAPRLPEALRCMLICILEAMRREGRPLYAGASGCDALCAIGAGDCAPYAGGAGSVRCVPLRILEAVVGLLCCRRCYRRSRLYSMCLRRWRARAVCSSIC